MQYLGRLLTVFAVYLLSISMAWAQEDDKGFLTRALQDALSGAGRAVNIDGFSGALSSTASFTQMTIADDAGVWLTLRDVALVWNRSALLRGRLEVERLTAAQLDLPRLPNAQEDALPDAEAKPFSLPDLPVSVLLSEFAIDQINLGAPLLGQAAQLSLRASAQLDDTIGAVELSAERTDGSRGSFEIKADLARSDGVLDLMLDLSEGPEGIAASLLNLPGQPDVDMSVQGSGPLDDFAADVRVTTLGQERLAGQVILGTQTPRRSGAAPDRRVQADIGGDITALLAPRYRTFFGEDVRLTADAVLESTGAIELRAFALEAQAAALEGKLSLNADKWPTLIDIRGHVANPDGTPILLPLGGAGTTVQDVVLNVAYDADNGDMVDAAFDMAGLRTTGADVGQVTLNLDGTLSNTTPSAGMFDGDVTFVADTLALTDPALAQAIGTRISGQTHITYAQGQPTKIDRLDLSGADYGLTGGAVIEGLESGFAMVLDAALDAKDLRRFSGIAGREIDGQSSLALKGRIVPLSGQFDVSVNGATQDLAFGIAQADAVLAGRTLLSLKTLRDETGTFLRDLVLENNALSLTGSAALRSDDSQVSALFHLQDVGLVVPQYDGPISASVTALQDKTGWSIDALTEGPFGAALTAKGLATGPNAAIQFSADVPDMTAFAPQIPGAIAATGTLRQTPDGWRVETDTTGPYQSNARLVGVVSPRVDITFDLGMPDLQPLVPQVTGPLAASGRLHQINNGFELETRASGPYGSQMSVSGQISPTMDVRFDLSMPNVAPLAPGISGPFSAAGTAKQADTGIAVVTSVRGPYASQGSVKGVVTGPNADVDFTFSMPNLGAIVEQVNGPLNLTGRAAKQGQAWRIDTDASGPSGTQATLGGVVGADGRLNLDIKGAAPLGLSRPFLAPRDLQGTARFDLTVNGAPTLSSVSGLVQTSGATFSAPNLRLALQGINAEVRLGGNRAQIDMSGQGTNGGVLRVGGGVTLTPSLPAELQIGLENIVLIDPRLYRTSLAGAVRVAGPLSGGAQISGAINVGETTVNVPSSGLTTIGDIPGINHIGATRPVMATRRKAGLDLEASGAESSAASGPGFGLDVQVSAPNRIFVRGRGLDAELGGGLTISGSTNRIISAGRFELLRGRLSILAQRFELEEGSIQFEGDLVPYIRFVSTTETNSAEVSVIVDGPADSPTVSFASAPEAPQDEVLAQLLFGRSISEISAFQALQLANAVATLAGKQGIGVISNLRAGFGLDDLDVTTSDSGATAVRAGKYISENVYTDVTAASDGTGEVSLNLDITSNLKGKATLGSDGNSGVGIFFEKDY
ncbi:MAG: translocation/assembly module TamB domain-containing protein [Sulfitobacter sp.]